MDFFIWGRFFFNESLIYFLTIIIGGLISLITLAKIWFVKSDDKKKSILILGPESSGKTALFLHLRNGNVGESVPSLKPNCDVFIVPNISFDIPISFVDYPGNRKLACGLESYVNKCCCIIYLIDGSSKQSVKAAAAHLYYLFSHKYINENRLPMMLFFNKSDLNELKGKCELLEDLELEIERLRSSNSACLEDEVESYLGNEDEVFKIEQLPFNVVVERGSVINGDVKQILNFIKSIIKA